MMKPGPLDVSVRGHFRWFSLELPESEPASPEVSGLFPRDSGKDSSWQRVAGRGVGSVCVCLGVPDTQYQNKSSSGPYLMFIWGRTPVTPVDFPVAPVGRLVCTQLLAFFLVMDTQRKTKIHVGGS